MAWLDGAVDRVVTILGGVGVGVGVAVVHVGTVIVSAFRVIAPLRARTRPAMLVPLSTVMEVSAKILPTKVAPVPSVAELPTCQNTLQAWAPLVRMTVLLDAVMRVEPAWKMNTALGLLPPFNVTDPVKLMEELEL